MSVSFTLDDYYNDFASCFTATDDNQQDLKPLCNNKFLDPTGPRHGCLEGELYNGSFSFQNDDGEVVNGSGKVYYHKSNYPFDDNIYIRGEITYSNGDTYKGLVLYDLETKTLKRQTLEHGDCHNVSSFVRHHTIEDEYTRQNKTFYGIFKDDRLDKGKLKYEGCVYKGEFCYWERHGKGKMTLNGVKYDGTFEDDDFHKGSVTINDKVLKVSANLSIPLDDFSGGDPNLPISLDEEERQPPNKRQKTCSSMN